jgi:outer membrane protein assembly factor BamD
VTGLAVGRSGVTNLIVRFASLALLSPMLLGELPSDRGMLWAAEGSGVTRQSVNLPASQCDGDLAIGRYYISKHDYTAAVGRFKTMVQKCPRSSGTPEALAFLTERYLAQGIASEAQTAVAVLEREFPGTQSTIEARNALRSAGLAPAENGKSWMVSAFR